jgi:hypothetical protein
MVEAVTIPLPTFQFVATVFSFDCLGPPQGVYAPLAFSI